MKERRQVGEITPIKIAFKEIYL